MKVPQYHELLNPTLSAVHKLGGSASINELVERVIADLELPQEVVEQLHGTGNTTELEYRLAWSRTYLKKFGLLNNSERGVWALTQEGVRTREVSPAKVVKFVQEEARERSRSRHAKSEEPEEIGLVDDETGSWRQELLETLMGMPPDAFERLCQRMLRESGFIEVEVTGRSGDGGIDGHGIIRIAGLISFTVSFQSKRWQGNIGPAVVRDFRGAMVGRADKGLLITTGSFTREARSEATRDGASPIDLIDGDLLVEKLKELQLGLETRQVEVVDVDRDWFMSL
jgi:restriction system protein